MATPSHKRKECDQQLCVEHDTSESTETATKSARGAEEKKCVCGLCALEWFQFGVVLVLEFFDLFVGEFYRFSVERCADSNEVRVCKTSTYCGREREITTCLNAFKTMLEKQPAACRFWVGVRHADMQSSKQRLYKILDADASCQVSDLPVRHLHPFPDYVVSDKLDLLATPICLDSKGFAPRARHLWDPVQPVFKTDAGGRCIACDHAFDVFHK
jgi:hypothetical protein